MWVSCIWFFGILSLFQPQPRTLYNGAACPSLLRASFQGVSCVPKAFVLSCSFDKILGSEDLAHSISLSHSPPDVLVIGTSHFSEEALPQGLVLHPNLAHWARLDTAPQQRTSSICCPKATSMTAPKTGLPSKRSRAACWTAHAHSETQTPTHTHTHSHLLRTIIANSDVECILRAKTLQLYLTGMGRWQDLRKYRKGTIAIAIARCNKLEADTSLSTKPNRSHPDRLRKPSRRWSDIKWNLKVWVWFETVWKNDMPVLGLPGCHGREMEIGVGTQIGVPNCITRSNGCLRW